MKKEKKNWTASDKYLLRKSNISSFAIAKISTW